MFELKRKESEELSISSCEEFEDDSRCQTLVQTPVATASAPPSGRLCVCETDSKGIFHRLKPTGREQRSILSFKEAEILFNAQDEECVCIMD